MKKSQLIKLIRETIKDLNEQAEGYYICSSASWPCLCGGGGGLLGAAPSFCQGSINRHCNAFGQYAWSSMDCGCCGGPGMGVEIGNFIEKDIDNISFSKPPSGTAGKPNFSKKRR